MASQRLTAISNPLREPIAPAFVTAMAVHAIVFLAIGFGIAWPNFESDSIAVTVVLTPANQAPSEARHVAALDQLGDEESVAPPAPTAQLQLQTTMTISRELDGADGALAPEDITPDAIQRQLQDLEQALSNLSDAQSTHNTRIGAVAARRSLDAEYLARWRAQVEQIGNVLYRGQPLNVDGDVRLLVTVSADGNLEQIRVLESSGDAGLDRAAQDTVVMAAPFPPFSAELTQRTPRLDIVRTWQFRTQKVPVE